MIKCKVLLVLPVIFYCLSESLADESTPKAEFASLKCNETGGCPTNSDECQKVCGCDGIYKFDDSKGECVIDFEYLKERTRSNNLMQTGKIRESTDKVFQGIIYCAVFFIACASVCVISVCVFCCHIHYSDEKLKKEVHTLASKLKVDLKKNQSSKKKTRDQKEESCNVIVEDANILCV